MSQRIDWTSGMKVPGGPELAVSRSVQAEAFGLIKVEIQDGDTDAVSVQPAGTGKVKFLAITSDRYEGLTYKVDADTTVVTVDQPQVLAGPGAMKLVDPTDSAPKVLNFSYTAVVANDKASLQILVGWDAKA